MSCNSSVLRSGKPLVWWQQLCTELNLKSFYEFFFVISGSMPEFAGKGGNSTPKYWQQAVRCV